MSRHQARSGRADRYVTDPWIARSGLRGPRARGARGAAERPAAAWLAAGVGDGDASDGMAAAAQRAAGGGHAVLGYARPAGDQPRGVGVGGRAGVQGAQQLAQRLLAELPPRGRVIPWYWGAA